MGPATPERIARCRCWPSPGSRVGIGEESADGQEQDGAEAQSQPRSNQETGGFAHGDGGYQQEEESQSAGNALWAAHGKEHQDQEREEDVDADLDTHPPAKRNRPTAHGLIVVEWRQLLAISF